MSFRMKKGSAFSLLKGRKSSSLTNVSDTSLAKTPCNGKKKRSNSASTTPNGSIKSTDSNISNFIDKITRSEKRKEKTELKKIKKILKNSTKSNIENIQNNLVSPLADEIDNGVKLKSMRPKGSMSNLNYQLPLRLVPEKKVSPKQMKKQISNEKFTQAYRSRTTSVNSAIERPTMPTPTYPARRSSSLKGTSDTPDLDSRYKKMNSDTSKVKKSNSTNDNKCSSTKRKRHSDGNEDATPKKQIRSKGNSAHSPSADDKMSERAEPLPSHPASRDNAMPYMFDSFAEASCLFECLIHPVKSAKFFSELWEKKPLLVKRHMPNYNDGWFSTEELDRIIKEEHVVYGKNIDITSYENDKRETHNLEGRAHAPVVWNYYQTGCSIRLLNPQSYSRVVWKLLSILQEFFGCFVGANIYLTPPSTQGFAPHYDDVEVFVLQLEGKKHWRLYSPRNDNESLPRYSSGNFSQCEIGDPILDVILEAGDILYFPRGTIHQGNSLEDAHSLHITVSCNQLNTWGDLLKLLIPITVNQAIEEDVEFRHSLPRNYLNYMGLVHSDKNTSERKTFFRKIEQLMGRLMTHAPVDAACDQMAKNVLCESLPPVLTEAEKKCSIFGSGESWDAKKMCVKGCYQITPDIEIKIIRKGCVRLIIEEDAICIYHNLENSRFYKELGVQHIEVTEEMAAAFEALIHEYPKFTKVENLSLAEPDDKVEFATLLYEKGLIITKDPLVNILTDSESESDVYDTAV